MNKSKKPIEIWRSFNDVCSIEQAPVSESCEMCLNDAIFAGLHLKVLTISIKDLEEGSMRGAQPAVEMEEPDNIKRVSKVLN